MTALLEVLGSHLQAVERDLLVAHYHLRDIGTPALSWAELESFVMAAPPGSATHTSRTGAWDRDAQMLAATTAQRGGFGVPTRNTRQQPQQQADLLNRPGQNLRNEFQQPPDSRNRQTKNLMSKATAMPLDQFKARMEKRHEQWRQQREQAKREAEGE